MEARIEPKDRRGGTPSAPPRPNNFDLIRILAALQVLIVHGHEHLKLAGLHPWLDVCVRALRYVPGVPVFFTVSGFLIVWSYDRNSDLRSFARNRLLRVFPGLWVAFFITVALLSLQGFITLTNLATGPMMLWIVGQLTLGQFYTPGALRGYGLGNPNGSLWTIVVELQFYAAVPILVWVIRRYATQKNTVLLALLLAMAIVNYAVGRMDTTSLVTKLCQMSLPAYLFYFLVGASLYLNWPRVAPWVSGRGPMWMLMFVAYSVSVSRLAGLYSSGYWLNAFGAVAAVLLALATISLAFTWPNAADRLLRGQDVSYGVYVYHAIVLNLLVQHGYVGHVGAIVALTAASLVIGFASWRLIERPALKRKRSALRQTSAATPEVTGCQGAVAP